MVAATEPPDADSGSDPGSDIERMNDMLAVWAARSAADSETLIDRFEAMGYEVRGKSQEEIADILHRKPTRAPAASSASAAASD